MNFVRYGSQIGTYTGVFVSQSLYLHTTVDNRLLSVQHSRASMQQQDKMRAFARSIATAVSTFSVATSCSLAWNAPCNCLNSSCEPACYTSNDYGHKKTLWSTPETGISLSARARNCSSSSASCLFSKSKLCRMSSAVCSRFMCKTCFLRAHTYTHTHNAAALNNLRDRIISCKEDALLFYPLHPARHNAIDQPSSLV